MTQVPILLQAHPRGYHLITDTVYDALKDVLPDTGLVHLFIKHTSAALTINENADPTVRKDFESFMNHIVPENMDFVTHRCEGSDDMPAHIKSSLLGASIWIPVSHGRFNLGTWQGIFLCEFRNHATPRKLIATIL